jgi:hypothetical protein
MAQARVERAPCLIAVNTLFNAGAHHVPLCLASSATQSAYMGFFFFFFREKEITEQEDKG